MNFYFHFPPILFSPGLTEAPEGPLLLPAGPRCSDSSQQGASAEERHVWQTHANEQEQDQKDGKAGHRPQDLPQMKRNGAERLDCGTTAACSSIRVQTTQPLDFLDILFSFTYYYCW